MTEQEKLTQTVARHIDDFETKFAVDGATEWVDDVIYRLERQIQELRGYRTRMAEHVEAGQLGDVADNLNWAVNSVMWLVPNMNIPAAAGRESKLRVAAARRRMMRGLA